MIIRYDSIAALADAYVKHNCHYGSGGWNRDSWFNNESKSESIRKARYGDTALVPKAEALLTQLDQAIETPRRQWELAPAGAFCSVPDMLAGRPANMRRMVMTQDEKAPITILATTTSSGGIHASTLQKRGTVILALVMALTRVRPVSLQQLTILDGRDNGETVITAEINTHPLDLATACYALTSAGFARRLTYGLAETLNRFTGGWPRTYRYGNQEPYLARLRQELAPDPTRCLIIGSAELHDELLQQPVAWIQKQIARFTQDQEELSL